MAALPCTQYPIYNHDCTCSPSGKIFQACISPAPNNEFIIWQDPTILEKYDPRISQYQVSELLSVITINPRYRREQGHKFKYRPSIVFINCTDKVYISCTWQPVYISFTRAHWLLLLFRIISNKTTWHFSFFSKLF